MKAMTVETMVKAETARPDAMIVVAPLFCVLLLELPLLDASTALCEMLDGAFPSI